MIETVIHINNNDINLSNNDDQFNIYSFVINNINLFDDNNTYYLEKNKVISLENEIIELSENNIELRVQINDDIVNFKKEVIDNILLYNFYYSNIQILNIIGDNDGNYIFILDQPYTGDRFNDNKIHFNLKRTDTFEINIDRIATPDADVVLTTHRKDNLQNYTDTIRTRYDRKKYGDVLDAKIETQDSLENKLFDENIIIDFSNFETHVRFGSALSKVINTEEKLKEIKILEDNIENDFNKSKNRNKLNRILESLSLYERYVYNELYKPLSDVEFNLWLNKTKEDATDYDAKNNDLLLYKLPQYFIENDEFGYLTNFCFLMGEFFDNRYMFIRSLPFVNEYSINEGEKISSIHIDDVLSDLGFDIDYRYTQNDFKDYFNNTDNLKKVSNVLASRIIDSMPMLTKMKGTRKSLEYLFNTFGIPKDIFKIVEYSSKFNEEGKTKFVDVESAWYLDILDDEYVSIGVDDSMYKWDEATYEFTIKKFRSSGILFKYTDDDYISYTLNNDELKISMTIDGSEVDSTTFTISEDDDLETNISFKINNDVVDIILSQKTLYTDDLINIQNESMDIGVGNIIEHFGINIMDVGIMEFRLFDSLLSVETILSHMLDIRSINEDTDSLIVRVNFYKPDNLNEFKASNQYDYYGEYKEIAKEDSYEIVNENKTEEYFNIAINLSSGIELNHFKKTQTKNTLSIDSIFSNDIYFDKIRVFDTTDSDVFLSSFIKRVNDEVGYEESSDIGIYLSENDIFNKIILRTKPTDVLINPEWNSDRRYSFSNFENMDVNYKDLSIPIEKIYDIFNTKILNVIEEFIPVRSKLQSGILIKNNILNKNKGLYEKKLVKSTEYEIRPVDLSTFKVGDSSFEMEKTDISLMNEDRYTDAEIYLMNPNLKIVLKTDRSRYLKDISGYDDAWKSPFLRRIIRGKPDTSEILTAEQLREFLNFGAQILVL